MTFNSYAECHYAECHYAECHYAECHYAQCHYAECRGALQHIHFHESIHTYGIFQGEKNLGVIAACGNYCQYKLSVFKPVFRQWQAGFEPSILGL